MNWMDIKHLVKYIDQKIAFKTGIFVQKYIYRREKEGGGKHGGEY